MPNPEEPSQTPGIRQQVVTPHQSVGNVQDATLVINEQSDVVLGSDYEQLPELNEQHSLDKEKAE